MAEELNQEFHHTTEQHIHLHLDGNVTIELAGPVTLNHQYPPRPAVRAQIKIGDKMSPGRISIDATTKQAEIKYTDDRGDTDAAAPDGAVVTFASDNDAVATVDPNTGAITPVAEGDFNVSATIAGADGSPIMEPDGVTPFTVEPSAETIVAGAAVGAELEIAG